MTFATGSTVRPETIGSLAAAPLPSKTPLLKSPSPAKTVAAMVVKSS